MKLKELDQRELREEFMRQEGLCMVSHGVYAPPDVFDGRTRISEYEWMPRWLEYNFRKHADVNDDVWKEVSENFHEKVYSLTSYPWHLKRIVKQVKGEKVLNIGTGSSPNLNLALIARGKTVWAVDISPTMLLQAVKTYWHHNLRYQLLDARTGFRDHHYVPDQVDTVLAVNSILPERREDVDHMLSEAYYMLREGGRFIGIFPEYHCHMEARDRFGARLQIDETNLRIYDTVGWQCVQTRKTIERHLTAAGFSNLRSEEIQLNTEPEKEMLGELYGIKGDFSFVELLVIADKT
ncbi:MAG TPA: class I SAM-dependent methyltransferase [Candidatus Nanoarchaeia archaeon]|nr:class I SAM-dependent methyltransferase [Candidatus Nanoarchaeia archaeon]